MGKCTWHSDGSPQCSGRDDDFLDRNGSWRGRHDSVNMTATCPTRSNLLIIFFPRTLLRHKPSYIRVISPHNAGHFSELHTLFIIVHRPGPHLPMIVVALLLRDTRQGEVFRPYWIYRGILFSAPQNLQACVTPYHMAWTLVATRGPQG